MRIYIYIQICRQIIREIGNLISLFSPDLNGREQRFPSLSCRADSNGGSGGTPGQPRPAKMKLLRRSASRRTNSEVDGCCHGHAASSTLQKSVQSHHLNASSLSRFLFLALCTSLFYLSRIRVEIFVSCRLFCFPLFFPLSFLVFVLVANKVEQFYLALYK